MILKGSIDGIEIIFDFYPPYEFKAIIPKRLNGKYIIQLKLVDDAGNEDNLCHYYMYLDFQNMTFKLLDDNFSKILKGEDFNSINLEKLYDFNFAKTEFEVNEICTQYDKKEVMEKWSFKEVR